MYVIKHYSRRTHDAPGTTYWVVCGVLAFVSLERALDFMFNAGDT